MFAMALMGAPVFAGAGELRTLTDTQGRSIRAEVLSVEGDVAQIRREDGRVFPLSVSSLNVESQGVVRHWANIAALAGAGAAGETAAGTVVEEPKPGDLTVTAGRRKGNTTRTGTGNSTTTEDEWAYTLRIRNNSGRAVADVEVKYILYVKRGITATSSEAMAKTEAWPGGSFVGNIAMRGEAEIATDFVTTRERRTRTRLSSRDTLYGIWLRVYAGGRLLLEQAMPEHLMETEVWTERKATTARRRK